MKAFVAFALLALTVYALPSLSGFNLHKRKMGSVVFTPAQLPCAYTISGGFELYYDGKLTQTVNQTIHRDGALFSQDFYTSGSFNYLSVRYDLSIKKDDKTYVPVYSADKGKKQSCQVDEIEKEDMDSRIDEALSAFMTEHTFELSNKTSFRGKKCVMYYIKDENTDKMLFANDDNYIIGYIERTGKSTMLVEVGYDFHVPMTLFAVDRLSYPGCDKKAYSIPLQQC